MNGRIKEHMMKYDIFISYRRKGGFETAKHLYDLLSRDGYLVSFDIDTLRNGDFDTTLLGRIEECTDFILILNEGAFDRTLDKSFNPKNDWLRCELAHALKHNKNVIPIMLEGFTCFPDNLPSDISKVVRKNGPKYDHYYFDDFYKKMKQMFFETPEPQPCGSVPSSQIKSIVKVISNMEFDCYIDGNKIERIQAHTLYQTPLYAGEYYFEFISTNDGCIDKIQRIIKVENQDITVEVDLEEVKLARVARENEARKSILQKYGSCRGFSCGLCRVETNGLYGYLNEKMDVVIPFIYEGGDDFDPKTSLARVSKDYKDGIIDKNGTIVIPFEYNELDFSSSTYCSDQYIRAQQGGFVGVIDLEGKILVPFEYGYVSHRCSNLFVVGKDGLAGVYDISMQALIIPMQYDEIELYPEYVILHSDNITILKSLNASLCLETDYEEIKPFCEDVAAFKANGLWGYMDMDGKVVVPAQFEDCHSFSCGLAPVCKDGKWGYINKYGWMKLKNEYDIAYSMMGGTAVVEKGNSKCIINLKGDILYPWTEGLEIFKEFYSRDSPNIISIFCLIGKDGSCKVMDEKGKLHNIHNHNRDGSYLYLNYDNISRTFSSACVYVDAIDFSPGQDLLYADDTYDVTIKEDAVHDEKIPSKKILRTGDIHVLDGIEGIVLWFNERTGEGKMVSRKRILSTWETPSFAGLMKKLQIKASTKTSSYDGFENCQMIRRTREWQTKYPAVLWCTELSPDKGWYLPAIGEFDYIFKSPEIQSYYNLEKDTSNLLGVPVYWTSTTPEGEHEKAWATHVLERGIVADRKERYYVVAMRKFKI